MPNTASPSTTAPGSTPPKRARRAPARQRASASRPDNASLVWDEALFASFTDGDINSPTIRSADCRREIWNRLCWSMQQAGTKEEFTAFTNALGVWVSAMSATDPDLLSVFAGFDQQLRPHVDALPSGREVADVSRRRTEVDDKGRVYVYLTTDEADVGDKTVAALAYYNHRARRIFRFGSYLVTCADGRLHRIEEAQMRSLLTRACRFMTLVGKPKKTMWQHAHPAVWLVKDLVARHDWPGIPVIRGLVSYPVFLASGRVLCAPGYDDESQLYVTPTCTPISVPDFPTRDDAVRASCFIYDEMFRDFPIGQPETAAVMLSALLTIVARFAINGPCPGFLLDGNAPGVGKGKLCQTIAIIATGRETTPIAPETRHDEWRKRIVSILRDSEPIAMVDNLAGAFGAPALDGVLTSTEWSDRELCTSSNWRGPANAVWFFTANNIRVQGDLIRRLLPMRIVSQEERPDSRRDFRHADLLAAASRMRPQLLQACFTILRAWHLAGMPEQALPAYGSYESWSKIVRQCVVWCGWADPRLAADYLREQPDEDESLFKSILQNWYTLQQALSQPAVPGVATIPGVFETCAHRHRSGQLGLTMQELLTMPEIVIGKAGVTEAILGLFQDGVLPTPHRLGIRLFRWKDRVYGGMSLSQRVVQGTTYWWVHARSLQGR